MANRRSWMTAAVIVACAFPCSVSAQTRLSLGVGGGIAGSTDASLSEGRDGVALMGQLVRGVLPFVGLGVDVDRWSRSGATVTFVTGVAQLHVPATGLLLRAGAGFGTGDPDGGGTASGVAGHIGLSYDITIPAAPVAVTLFGNASLAYSSSRSMQLVDAGIAITLR